MDTASTDGIFDISNADRLGFSEVMLVQKVVDGVDLLIQVNNYYMQFHCHVYVPKGPMETRHEINPMSMA